MSPMNDLMKTIRDPEAGADVRVAAAGKILDLVIAEEIKELRRRIARLERNRRHEIQQ